MEKIQEIIFLPSLRCNLNCKHCGEIQDVRKDQEVDCLMVLQQLESSILLEKGLTISVSGGEPFLNPSFVSFLSEGVKRTDFCFHVTTNGYYYQDIKKLTEAIFLPGGGVWTGWHFMCLLTVWKRIITRFGGMESPFKMRSGQSGILPNQERQLVSIQ